MAFIPNPEKWAPKYAGLCVTLHTKITYYSEEVLAEAQKELETPSIESAFLNHQSAKHLLEKNR